MEMNEYQELAARTAQFPFASVSGGKFDIPWIYPLFGLNGEVGEVTEKLKKVWRNRENITLSPDDIRDITNELGDVLWYLSMLAEVLGIELGDIAQTNIDKLQRRLKNNTVRGEGDNR